MLEPPKRPCGSCPYRRDVPSGIWSAEEYDKLPEYDGETWEQPPGVFMCHQRDGRLCGGWLQTHDADHLLALRIARVAPSAYDYASDVPTFSSPRAARYRHPRRSCKGAYAQAGPTSQPDHLKGTPWPASLTKSS